MEELEQASKNGEDNSVEDSIFRRISIPRTLGNIPMDKVEKDLFGQSALTSYHKIVTGVDQTNIIHQEINDSDGSDSSSSSDSED